MIEEDSLKLGKRLRCDNAGCTLHPYRPNGLFTRNEATLRKMAGAIGWTFADGRDVCWRCNGSGTRRNRPRARSKASWAPKPFPNGGRGAGTRD